jgi:hypothetical protein
VLSATPARLTTDSQKHADVWNEWGGRGAGEHVRAQDMGNTMLVGRWQDLQTAKASLRGALAQE